MKDTISSLIRVYENALAPEVCTRLTDFFENNVNLQRLNGKAISENLVNSQWTELDLTQHLDNDLRLKLFGLFKEYKSIYEQDCGVNPSLPNPMGLAPMMMKRYSTNGEDNFEPHYDSVGPKCNRYLVFLFYLNDVDEGGETEFVEFGLKVKPKKGSLLVFPPYWMYLHQAKKPISNSKYILSTYYLWW